MKPLALQKLIFLQLIATFGYLSTKDFAKLCWATNEPHSAHVMAQTNLTKLSTAGYIIARDMRQRPGMKAPLVLKAGAARGYVLTQKGAAVLNELYAEEWLFQPSLSDSPMPWFADAYNLSLANHVMRAPLIDTCHKLLSTDVGGMFIGQRGLARNFLGLAHLAHFDAVFYNAASHVEFGIYLAHHRTDVAAKEIVKLAQGAQPFLICCPNERRLTGLQRWRDRTNPEFGQLAAATGIQA